MKIVHEEFMRQNLNIPLAYERMRDGFIAHSLGKVVSSIHQVNIGKGSLHIKCGAMEGEPHLFIKHATGVSDNRRLGLPTGDGCILCFSSSTGLLEAVLLDRGYLTGLRTALAARLCVEQYRPERVEIVGILGTGVQARLCAQQQALATQCRSIHVWGRNSECVDAFKKDLEAESFQVTAVNEPNALLETSDLVITTTSSSEALLSNIPDRRAKLIVAMGADERGKQELDPLLVASAQLLIADDVIQSSEIGEFQNAIRLNLVKPEEISELGRMLSEGHPFSSQNLVICDLSGLPVQDIQIAKTILEVTDWHPLESLQKGERRSAFSW